MANGLDPRVLQQQGRAFQIASNIILQKRQQEAQIEEEAKRTMLTAGTKLFANKNIPPEQAANLFNALVQQMGVNSEVTGEELSTRSRDLAAEGFGMSAALQSLGDNPENVQAGLGVLSDPQAGLGGFTSTIDPEVQQRIATGGATERATGELGALRREKRITEVAFTRDEILARIAKLNRETSNIGKAGGPKITDLLTTLKDLERSVVAKAEGRPLQGIEPGTAKDKNVAKAVSLKVNQARNAIFNQLAESKDLPGLQEFFLFQQNPIAAEQRPPEIQAQIDRAVTGQPPSPESSQQPGLVTAGTQEVATVSPQSAGGARQQGAPARPITALRKAVDAKEIKPEVFARRLSLIPNMTAEQFQTEIFRLAKNDTLSEDKAVEIVLKFEQRALGTTSVLGPPSVR